MKTNNKVALITGANQGIGLQVAKELAAKDVTVPKGTYLELTSGSPFDSEHVRKTDTFTATVTKSGGASKGLASLCIGGGEATAMAVELA